MLCFQLCSPITRRYNRRTVREASLQSIKSLRKIQAISIIANTATGKLHHLSQMLSAKRTGTQKRTKESP